MAETQYVSNMRSAQSTVTRPTSASVAAYLIFAVAFGFTAAIVFGLIH